MQKINDYLKQIGKIGFNPIEKSILKHFINNESTVFLNYLYEEYLNSLLIQEEILKNLKDGEIESDKEVKERRKGKDSFLQRNQYP